MVQACYLHVARMTLYLRLTRLSLNEATGNTRLSRVCCHVAVQEMWHVFKLLLCWRPVSLKHVDSIHVYM